MNRWKDRWEREWAKEGGTKKGKKTGWLLNLFPPSHHQPPWWADLVSQPGSSYCSDTYLAHWKLSQTYNFLYMSTSLDSFWYDITERACVLASSRHLCDPSLLLKISLMWGKLFHVSDSFSSPVETVFITPTLKGRGKGREECELWGLLLGPKAVNRGSLSHWSYYEIFFSFIHFLKARGSFISKHCKNVYFCFFPSHTLVHS